MLTTIIALCVALEAAFWLGHIMAPRRVPFQVAFDIFAGAMGGTIERSSVIDCVARIDAINVGAVDNYLGEQIDAAVKAMPADDNEADARRIRRVKKMLQEAAQ